MKRRLMFALGIIMTAGCLGLTSCGDDDDKDEPKEDTCFCTEYDAETNEKIGTGDIAKGPYHEDCDDLADYLNGNADFYYVCQ